MFDIFSSISQLCNCPNHLFLESQCLRTLNEIESLTSLAGVIDLATRIHFVMIKATGVVGLRQGLPSTNDNFFPVPPATSTM